MRRLAVSLSNAVKDSQVQSLVLLATREWFLILTLSASSEAPHEALRSMKRHVKSIAVKGQIAEVTLRPYTRSLVFRAWLAALVILYWASLLAIVVCAGFYMFYATV